jgi:hypothetical protein
MADLGSARIGVNHVWCYSPCPKYQVPTYQVPKYKVPKCLQCLPRLISYPGPGGVRNFGSLYETLSTKDEPLGTRVPPPHVGTVSYEGPSRTQSTGPWPRVPSTTPRRHRGTRYIAPTAPVQIPPPAGKLQRPWARPVECRQGDRAISLPPLRLPLLPRAVRIANINAIPLISPRSDNACSRQEGDLGPRPDLLPTSLAPCSPVRAGRLRARSLALIVPETGSQAATGRRRRRRRIGLPSPLLRLTALPDPAIRCPLSSRFYFRAPERA